MTEAISGKIRIVNNTLQPIHMPKNECPKDLNINLVYVTLFFLFCKPSGCYRYIHTLELLNLSGNIAKLYQL